MARDAGKAPTTKDFNDIVAALPSYARSDGGGELILVTPTSGRQRAITAGGVVKRHRLQTADRRRSPPRRNRAKSTDENEIRRQRSRPGKSIRGGQYWRDYPPLLFTPARSPPRAVTAPILTATQRFWRRLRSTASLSLPQSRFVINRTGSGTTTQSRCTTDVKKPRIPMGGLTSRALVQDSPLSLGSIPLYADRLSVSIPMPSQKSLTPIQASRW